MYPPHGPVPAPPVTDWDPDSYVELAASTALTAPPARLAATVGHAAVLLAGCGFAGESDRLITTWRRTAGSAVEELFTDAVTRRAVVVLAAHRPAVPGWAAELVPPDLNAEQRAHRAYLSRRQHAPSDLLGRLVGDAGAEAATELAGDLASSDARSGDGAEPEPADPLRPIAAEADDAALAGDIELARAALHRWAFAARGRAWPPVAMLAGCRNLAGLLLEGALAGPLGVGDSWAQRCAGELQAVLRGRHPREHRDRSGERTMGELVSAILAARHHPDVEPPPVPSPAPEHRVSEAERTLGVALPADYREFLRTCDGLPSDVVFPRLLGAAELYSSTERGIVISAPGPTGVLVLLVRGRSAARTGARDDGAAGRGATTWYAAEWDPQLGTSMHTGFRPLLERHLHLLEQCR
ncbi:SMI1/KNR4 family protein [Haloechinothrix sp. YIM 98757]|uniref:SMI1/KNR4 family protein n=1 Tax=Haloechinothrix aidingensis TaxID=2752311 RepID=A0A837ZZB8_9PSEU|nr:SMI1/KNR4 family protein [Haloechinothrix aidingensis]MBA0125584.1 SMI1/KNR4 family protein [Haloechinothrix aidingensis]